MRLVLASASPRRRALLAAEGLTFDVVPSGIEERLAGALAAGPAAAALARDKAQAVAAQLRESAVVLGADTLVVVGAADAPLDACSVLGKPADADAARRTLVTLSGTRHRVVTGLCALAPAGTFLDSETTWVTMRPWTAAEIEAYVASDEWRDKAGGYAIQSGADRFVTALEGGGFDNVVGLPVARALALLRRAGWPDIPR
ncbi:MAG: Maf family protein [Planctomycetota bacterium]